MTIGQALANQVISAREKAEKTGKAEDWKAYMALRSLLPRRIRYRY
jgi:hypothetical protein